MSKSHLNEDKLTEVLAAALEQPEIYRAFLNFLFNGKAPQALTKAESHDICVQYRFPESACSQASVGSRGRLDMLLIAKSGNNRFAVAVEHKVWDEEKPSRLHNYRLLLDGENFRQSWLFEIVRAKDYDLSSAEYIESVLLWRNWYSVLKAMKPESPRAELHRNRVLLAINQAGALEDHVIQRGIRHRVSLSAESFLNHLLDQLSVTTTAKKVTDRGVPVAIRTGLSAWEKTHQGRWHDRIWIYIKEPNPGVFAFQMQVIFHNANFTDLEYSKTNLPRWAPAFKKLGLDIYRGPNRGWDGAKRVPVTPPYSISTTPKYFYAEEPESIAFKKTSKTGTGDSLLKDAIDRAHLYLKTFSENY